MNSIGTNYYIGFFLFVVVGFQFSDAQHWDYEQENAWATDFPVCGSETQSPIDFIPDSIVQNTTIPAIQFHGYDAVLNFTEFNLTNNGHSVQMNIGNTGTGSIRGTPFVISGGGLPSNFSLAQFHFHWGRLNGEGSEHTVQAAAYPMELHLVHWDSIKYDSSNVAANQSEGLAVLGIFVQIGETNNSAFDHLIRYFGSITYKDGTADQVTQFPLAELLPSNTKDFYRYRGSLTTPPCYNSVIWTVFVHPITISEPQLQEFRTRLYEESINDSGRTYLADNYRVTQSVNTRTVYKTFEKVVWSYHGADDGPADWKNFFPRCNGEFQSPIDISTASVVINNTIQSVTVTNYDSVPSGTTFTLFNTGTSVDLMVGGGRALTVSGGGLVGDYVLEKVSLHWGGNNGLGSEHRVNSLSYPLEVQYLHYSSKYSSISEASPHIGGLAVLSVFFQANPEDNQHLNPIFNRLQDIRVPGPPLGVSTFSLMNLIPTDDKSFYRYAGSLTVPNCAETVTWIVFTEPLHVSAKQMDLIRNVSSTIDGIIPLANNFRPTQALNSRIISKAFHKADTGSADISSTISNCLFVLTICLASYIHGI